MAKSSIELIDALRTTANRLRNGAYYAWGNHGACNCGNLLQSVTTLSKEDIVRYAQSGTGEWTELAEEYCGDTNVPVNLLLQKLQTLSLTPVDIHNIEYLQDKEILNALPGGFRWLKRNIREDVIVYFETFANILEEKLISKIEIPYEQLMQQHKQQKKILQLETT